MDYTACRRPSWVCEWSTCQPLRKTSAASMQNYFIKVNSLGKVGWDYPRLQRVTYRNSIFPHVLSVQNLHVLDCSWNIQVSAEQHSICAGQGPGCSGHSFLWSYPPVLINISVGQGQGCGGHSCGPTHLSNFICSSVWDPSHGMPWQTRWTRNGQRLEIGYFQSGKRILARLYFI